MPPPASGSRRRTSARRIADEPPVEPLRLTIDVDCAPEHAFAVWTERFSLWWPADHTVTGDPDLVALEPRLGGRIYERGPDGTEHDWGEVTVWEPPQRLGYLWHLMRDRADATEVEIALPCPRDRAPASRSSTGAGNGSAPTPTVWRTRNHGRVEHVAPPLRQRRRDGHERPER